MLSAFFQSSLPFLLVLTLALESDRSSQSSMTSRVLHALGPDKVKVFPTVFSFLRAGRHTGFSTKAGKEKEQAQELRKRNAQWSHFLRSTTLVNPLSLVQCKLL